MAILLLYNKNYNNDDGDDDITTATNNNKNNNLRISISETKKQKTKKILWNRHLFSELMFHQFPESLLIFFNDSRSNM